ncbi:MAG: ClpP family protease [Pseudonocardiaceae bacterium]
MVPRMRRNGTSGLALNESVQERLLESRIVVLGSEVTDEVANRIIGQLLVLAAESGNEDITLYINSPGGSVPSGFAIYDTMQLIPPDVVTVAMGMAASMGQFLLCAGALGKRYALPHTRVMMHQPSSGISGTAADIAIQADLFGKWKIEIASLTAERTGQTVEKVIADGERDRWFTPEEAKEYGIIDHVLTHGSQIGWTNGSRVN